MIAGEARRVAGTVGAELGIDEVFAEDLLEDKDKAITELQQRGLSVAMVGDGVNDATALARADVGLDIGAASTSTSSRQAQRTAGRPPRCCCGWRSWFG